MTTPEQRRFPADEAAASDVLVVGAGPVGLTTAILLARRGRRVTVLERFPEPYAQPRAVHFDDEVARLLAATGVDPSAPGISRPADLYEWQNAAGDTLLRFDWSGLGPSGWPTATMFHQPDLEAALLDAADAQDGVTVLRGREVTGLVDRGDRVEASTADGAVFTASWLVGCDGANSFVRGRLAVGVTDLGFFYDWLIVDVRPHEDRTWSPTNLQVCDPARPTTAVSGGPGRRRWEFMRMPGEDVADLNTEATAWTRLAAWGLTPDNAILERHTVYTFQARWADTWREGRVLLAGDAAHLMPPFAGQGMCSGIRDAANLAWKLDLVLAGHAGTSLLDTYTSERRAHVQHAIGMSVELGKVICVTDAEAAAQRDAFMISQGGDPAAILPPLPPPMLTEGLLHRTLDGTPAPGSGVLSPQARVQHRGRTGRLDDVVGTGSFLVAATVDPTTVLTTDQQSFLKGIGARVLHLVPAGSTPEASNAAVDIDDFYLPHLSGRGHVGVVIRPDHYLFSTATTGAALAAQIDDLRRQLRDVPAPGLEQLHLPPVAAAAGPVAQGADLS
jgi:2-polyprenyl-6-methoxyphenol hydroxylase-like FAD-dependent oxidoreductase